ncbi:hypothetical protein NLM33_17420 [Bradyrhizobium sp. CCGUVB1N3]|nr:hypothetical protein [Bradyrhizobium sp. CCGUVB1N3]MCP3472100.1 hypothetical protein [Bradyrhizobium sp. CCGUVB1N3]
MFRTKRDRIRRTTAHTVFFADCDRNGTSTRAALADEITPRTSAGRKPGSEANVAPHRLEIEITESMLLSKIRFGVIDPERAAATRRHGGTLARDLNIGVVAKGVCARPIATRSRAI